MGDAGWESQVAMPLPGRSEKPRSSGITMVMDKGLGPQATADLLAVAAGYIDIMKLTAGTPLLYPSQVLREKVAQLKGHRIRVLPGGTLTEIALWRKSFEGYLDYLQAVGFDAVEVADGSITLSLEERRDAIRCAAGRGLFVLSEVGKEEPDEALDVDELICTVRHDLDAGSALVTMEAREFGKVGIYDERGEIEGDLLERLLAGIRNPEKILWEAPLFHQQVGLVTRLGNNVNLGNIAPTDVLRLETLRRGTVGDSLRLALRRSGC